MSPTLPFGEARTALTDLINRAQYQGTRTVITRHGRPVAAIISIADLEMLTNLIALWGIDAIKTVIAAAQQQAQKTDVGTNESG